MRLYVQQRGDSLEAQNVAAEIRLRAERRAGEMLKVMPKNEGGRPVENRSDDRTGFPATYVAIGISKNQASDWHRDSASDLLITKFRTLASSNIAKILGKTAHFPIEAGPFDGLIGHLRNPCVKEMYSARKPDPATGNYGFTAPKIRKAKSITFR